MHIHVKNILAALAVMACALPLLAVDRTWDGEGGDLSWDTAENWSADSKPGLGDRARFDSAVVAGSTILLGADQTIDSLFLVGSAAYTLDGGANTLTLATGSIFAGGSSGTSDIKLAGTVVLGTNGVWSVPGGWGSKITVEGVLSDNGMGYGFETASDQNDNHVLTGSNTLSGTILIRCNGFTVAGANGVFTDATVLLDDGMDKNATTLYIDNTILNDDRFGANVVLGASGNGGEIRFNEGEYTYTETVGRLSLRGGNLHLHRRKGVPTLEFMNYDRVPGSSLTFDVLGANFRCVIQGENANSGGFWQPWAVEFYYEPDLIKVDSSGELSLVPLNEYATLAASGHDPLKPALMTTATNILSEGGEVSALNCRYSSGAMTLDLGTNDLLIGRGVLIVNSHSLLIDSDGGRLTFGGNEVIIVPRVLGGSRTVRVHAPLHADGSGPKYLLVPRSSGNVELVMDGPDMIGTYDTIFANMDSSDGSKLHLGGPSDRAVTNSLAGRFALIKEGEGSLTLSGNDTRGEVTGTVVSNGILRIASANGLRSTHPGHTTVAEGGTLEVAENTLWPGQFTVKSGGTLAGAGTFSASSRTLNAGTRFSPGTKDIIGTLTFSAALTVPSDAEFDIKIGLSTNDLVQINNNFALPGSTETLYLTVADILAGAESVTGKSYVVARWTGNNPSTAPAWSVTAAVGTEIDTSAAVVTVDTANKQIVLSGLKSAKTGTLILVQ